MQIITAVLLLTVPAQEERLHDSSLLSRASLDACRQAVRKTLAAEGIPGLSIAVLVDDRVAWAEGFGKSDIENSVRATARTSYRWASVSKAVTSMAVMQMVEAGKIRLEEDIRVYVPEFPKKEKGTVCVRDLLCHQSGVRHYKNREEILSTRPFRNLKEGLDLFKDDPLRFKPGTNYGYTTYGYSLLGRAVETVSEMDFRAYLKRHIFDVSGMATARDDSVFALIPHRAQGYVRVDSKLVNSALADTSYKVPGGGLCGSVVDLASFLSATMNDRLVRRETFERMAVAQKTADGKTQRHGLGWTVGTLSGRKLVGHGGAQQRVSAWTGILPRERLGIALLCNLERVGGKLNELAARIVDLLVTDRLRKDF